jgi:hypothetical protein
LKFRSHHAAHCRIMGAPRWTPDAGFNPFVAHFWFWHF